MCIATNTFNMTCSLMIFYVFICYIILTENIQIVITLLVIKQFLTNVKIRIMNLEFKIYTKLWSQIN